MEGLRWRQSSASSTPLLLIERIQQDGAQAEAGCQRDSHEGPEIKISQYQKYS